MKNQNLSFCGFFKIQRQFFFIFSNLKFCYIYALTHEKKITTITKSALVKAFV